MKSRTNLVQPSEATGCCGGPPPAGIDACCRADADAKAEGLSGCGCTTGATQPARQPSAGACCEKS